MSERRYSRHVGADLSLHFTPEGKQCTFCNEQPSQKEEPLADNIDRTLLAKLEGMRAARDEAVRYAQTLNDEAALHRIEDERLRAQATRIIDQVNEGTPVPEDS